MQAMEKPEQYGRCLVLAGGGFRFGVYLGVHAALEAAGRHPDILLASCGGAIAGAVIAALPDAQARRSWVAGPAMYDFLRAIAPTARATPLRTLGHAAARWLDRRPVPRVPDLAHDYLFELPAALPLPPTAATDGPALAIVGARLLFAPHDVGTRTRARPLFEETVFCPPRAASLLDGMASPAADARWSRGAVAPFVRADSAMTVADAVRISIADMFYFRCHQHGAHRYTGGVVDLFPIEVAGRLARDVTMERKSPFNPWFALPALRAVLGLDGAARLDHVHAQRAQTWFDTADASRALRAHGVGKHICWRRNRVALRVPATHAEYAAQVGMQWEYGYRQGMAAIEGVRQ
jgi:hypothetical protein